MIMGTARNATSNNILVAETPAVGGSSASSSTAVQAENKSMINLLPQSALIPGGRKRHMEVEKDEKQKEFLLNHAGSLPSFATPENMRVGDGANKNLQELLFNENEADPLLLPDGMKYQHPTVHS